MLWALRPIATIIYYANCRVMDPLFKLLFMVLLLHTAHALHAVDNLPVNRHTYHKMSRIQRWNESHPYVSTKIKGVFLFCFCVKGALHVILPCNVWRLIWQRVRGRIWLCLRAKFIHPTAVVNHYYCEQNDVSCKRIHKWKKCSINKHHMCVFLSKQLRLWNNSPFWGFCRTCTSQSSYGGWSAHTII